MMTQRQINSFIVRGIVASALAFAWACWAAGCASQPDKLYRIDKPVTIVVRDGEAIGRSMSRETVRGTCLPDVRWLQVPWDGDHPDFYVLGHEIWHLPELGGDFHE
jgi:hypothetical protein